jgi:hypothetical protein
MRWASYVARIGTIRNTYKIVSLNLKERDHSENIVVDGRISLCILITGGGYGLN